MYTSLDFNSIIIMCKDTVSKQTNKKILHCSQHLN